jgi:hypothetical protein
MNTRGVLRPASRLAAVMLVVLMTGMNHSAARRRATTFQAFPRLTVWAWEVPEDLRALDPRRYAVAYLDRTIFVSPEVSSRPRMQRLLVSPGTKVIAVVRIEPPAASADLDAPDLPSTIAGLIERSAEKPGISALQVDFDATRSQRVFYADVLREVRKRLPNGMPLSVTALASWCSADDWISDLPVDEAVPMFFRMGRKGCPSNEPGWTYPIREPLCGTSAGLSTDEPWPAIRPDERVYIFHPGPWNAAALWNVEAMVRP